MQRTQVCAAVAHGGTGWQHHLCRPICMVPWLCVRPLPRARSRIRPATPGMGAAG